ncbi:hypothetical protein CBR_g30359 [Chara braunii]|uniref:C2H2-type domain-containing protein n=1 Tax=Chara braunii TaxID=69332 RepID=A0A388JX83_CHABU|nr:hypothetical protein CBR_g30359 [Chara braunii]|eukprot:GBG62406.1 hypothetical protein CBR_g30359 [Chara braunii]
MSVLTCNACNVTFSDEPSQKAHYRCDWHRYNLKRKVAGLPGVTSAWFEKRRESVDAERNKNAERMVYVCQLCGKQYSSKQAHEQHLNSKAHLVKLSASPSSVEGRVISVVRPAPSRDSSVQQAGASRSEPSSARSGPVGGERLGDGKGEKESEVDDEDSDEEGEWTVVENELEAAEALAQMSIHGEDDGGGGGSRSRAVASPSSKRQEDDANGTEEAEAGRTEDDEEWDPCNCMFCRKAHEGVDECVEHMHREHGFFIPDAEYLKDLTGLLEYLWLKITKGFLCLYCDGRGRLLHSKEAARNHMISKSHCKLRFGELEDGDEELEEFYDYTSSYEESGELGQMILAGDAVQAPVELLSGGMELGLKGNSKIIGSRQLVRIYRQRPRPSENREMILVNKLVARYRSLGLATRQADRIPRRHDPIAKAALRTEASQLKLGLKSNIIRNLPKNCTH